MRTCLLVLLSLILACCSNPGMPAPWLAWLALVPLFIAAETTSDWRRSVMFGAWGIGWWCWSAWWLAPAAVQFIGLAPWLAHAMWFVICVVMSAPYWIIGASWNLFRFENIWLSCIARAALFTVAVSLLSSWIPASIVSGQHVYAHLIQIVDIGGVPSLLFALVLINLLLAHAVRFTPSQVYFLIAAFAVLASLSSYGQLRIADINNAAVTTLTVGYVQPNLQRDDKIDTLIELTRQLAHSEPDIDLLAWPEFPPAFSWSDNEPDHDRVNALLRDIGKPLLLSSGHVSAAEWNASGGPRPYHTAAQLISADGKLLGSYYKQQLVPFFEFLPFEQHFPTLRQHFPNTLSHVAGSSDKPLMLDDNIRIAPLPGYEMIFPAIASSQIANGANVFINLSNDGWLGDSRGSISHLALAQFRAVEHHRPWIRVTNSGISTAASASGELLPLAHIELAERDTRVVNIAIPASVSFYSRYPRAFIHAASALLLLTLAWKLYRSARLRSMSPGRATEPR